MKVIRAINHFFTWLCMFFIVALMMMMVAEVVLRSFFNSSILGATEWAAMLLLFELTAMGASILSNRMIKVNMVTQYFGKKAQVILDTVLMLLCFASIGFIAWRQMAYAIQSYHNNTAYSTIHLPQWPFIALFSISYGVAAITALTLMIRKIVSVSKGQWEKEAALEDMDPVFVFGKKMPARLQALWNGGKVSGDVTAEDIVKSEEKTEKSGDKKEPVPADAETQPETKEETEEKQEGGADK